MFELSFLGGAVVEDVSGASSDLSSRKHVVALLALLATTPTRRLSRSKLIGLLWSEAPEAKGRNRLNTYVHRIRSELGIQVLRSVGDDLRLERDRVSCDVWRFEDALDRGEWESAVALYRGPFLDGFIPPGAVELERWFDLVRDRLSRAYRDALEQLAAQAEHRGDLERAARWWRTRHDDEPLNARVASRLMRTLAAAGNRAGGLRVGEDQIRRAQLELGSRPNPEILALLEELRAPPLDGTAPAAEVREGSAAGAAASDDGMSEQVATPPTAAMVDPARAASGTPGGVRPGWPRRTALPALLVIAFAAALGGWALLGPEAPPSHDDGRGAAAVTTHSAEAYELYLRARELDRNRDLVGTRGRKTELYRRALELDPDFAEAWAGLADAYLENAWAGGGLEPWADAAAASARRALDLDPVSADAYSQLGDVYWTLGRRDQARASYVRALEIEPGHGESMNNLLVMLAREGRLAERMGWLDRFVAISAESSGAIARLAVSNADLGRDDVARAWLELGRERGYDLRWTELHLRLVRWQDLERASALVEELADVETTPDPSYRITRRRAALALYEGDLETARRYYQALYPGIPRSSFPIYKGLLWDPLGLAHTLVRLGDRDRADRIAREVIATARRELATDPDHLPRHRLAVAHHIVGDDDAALDWLEDSVDGGYRNTRAFETVPTLEGLRDHPRFRALVARMGAALQEERRRVEMEGWGMPQSWVADRAALISPGSRSR